MRTATLDQHIEVNRAAFDRVFGERAVATRKCIDTQHQLTSMFFGFLGARHLTHHGEAQTPIFSALMKNELALYASLSLTRDGLYGVASAQLRSVYEALMIAKLSALLQHDPLIDRWVAGETIYFANAVLKRIVQPQMPELSLLWKSLCNVSHATVYSFQVETEFEQVHKELSGTLAIIGMLLCCNFHLLNRHFITRAMEYLIQRYGDGEEFKRARLDAKGSARACSIPLSTAGRAVVREYSRSWRVRPG